MMFRRSGLHALAVALIASTPSHAADAVAAGPCASTGHRQFDFWLGATRKVWHQTWVDSNGLLLTLEGGWDGKAMVMEGDSVQPGGTRSRQRITWTPNADGSVRQLWEAANAKGEWTTVFDGRYAKK